MRQVELFIHGETRTGNGPGFSVVNPATAQAIADVRAGSSEDVDAAVASCRQGQEQWARTTPAERAAVLNRAGAGIRARLPEIARLEVADTGKPITEAEAYDIPSAAEVFEFFAGAAAVLHGHHVDLGAAHGGSYFYTRREPLGVCAGIGAWNYPFQIAAWKAAPCLAAGNAMLFKPSELAPMTAGVLAEILMAAGLPAGCFNVIHGDANVGRALTAHADIAKISVTGEVETGKAVMAGAAKTLKHVTMELGGKSPLIIFDDCDVDSAVNAALAANYFSQGQVCTNGTRVFVHQSLHDDFVRRVVSRIQELRLGDPLLPETHMGALISAEHKERVEAFIADGVSAGATAHLGGALPSESPFDAGYFVRPVVFDGCTDEMRIIGEEIFGPVMGVLTFACEDEVIERANNTELGLAAGVFTQNMARAHRVAARVQAGVCWINNYNVTPVEMPFGGVKHSGIGRENGLACLDHYTQTKSVYVELGSVGDPWASS